MIEDYDDVEYLAMHEIYECTDSLSTHVTGFAHNLSTSECLVN